MTATALNSDKPRATIRCVALEAGVSASTVSRAFSGNRPISKTVKKRILSIADQLGYRPHLGAQALATNRTNRIGVIVRSLVDEYSGLYVQALEEAAAARGYEISLCITSPEDTEKSRRQLDRFSRGQADGVIVYTTAVPVDMVTDLADNGYPVITPGLMINGHESVCGVQVIHLDVFDRMLEYLWDMGHRKFGFMWEVRSGVPQHTAALEEFLSRKGITLASNREVDSIHSVEQAEAAGTEMLRRCREVTAVVCANDAIAVGAMAAARTLGMSVPKDLSVTGYYDLPIGRYHTPRPTTVRSPIRDDATAVVNKMIDRIEGKPETPTIKLTPELLLRESSGPPRQS